MAAIRVKYCARGTYRQVLLKKEVRRGSGGTEIDGEGLVGGRSLQTTTNHRAQPPSLFEIEGTARPATRPKTALPQLQGESLGELALCRIGRGSRGSVIKEWIVNRNRIEPPSITVSALSRDT